LENSQRLPSAWTLARIARRQERLQHKYDPRLLLQSMEGVRVYAELLYREGLQKFKKKKQGNSLPPKILEFKRTCINQAQQYVVDRLKAEHLTQEEAREDQFAQGVEVALKPQLAVESTIDEFRIVMEQIKKERAKMASELGKDFLPKEVCIRQV
jgi:hypothetical protein